MFSLAYPQKTLLISFSLLATIATSCTAQQYYYEDFETAEIGDLVNTVGIGGALGALEIQNVGVDESNGFQVPPIDNFWIGSFLPETVCLKEVGQRLTLAVDAKVDLFSIDSFFSNEYNVLFDFALVVTGVVSFAQFAITDDALQFTTGQFHGFGSTVSEDFQPTTAIGMNSAPGSSEYFRFQWDILKLTESSFCSLTSVFNKNGELLSQGSFAVDEIGEDLGSPTNVILTMVAHFASQSISFDNIRIQVTNENWLAGDMNNDGLRTLLDVEPFVQLIVDGRYQPEGDINFDCKVDLLDISGFVELLSAD